MNGQPVRGAGALAGSIFLSVCVVAGVISAPALASAHHSATHLKGTKIGSRVTKTYGRVVASSKGRVMYVHTTDKGSVSRCSGACAAAWPRVTSKGKPVAGKDISGGHLKRNTKGQVTYFGHPLYYFAPDKAPGKITGEGLVHFFVVSTKGTAITKPVKTTKPATGPTGPAEVTTGTVGSTEVIRSRAGRTLYALDSPTEVSQLYCKGGCLSSWLPLLTKGAPTAAGDAVAGLVGTIARSGIGSQVTYNGYPLYTFTGDTAAGQGNGEGVFGPLYVAPAYTFQYWYDVTPAGGFHL